MQGGQKQLDELKAEVASRDRLVSELKVEVEAERTAAEARARELEAGWEQRERQAQAEVAAKVQVRGRVCVRSQMVAKLPRQRGSDRSARRWA